MVVANELPNLPHLELETVGNVAVAKVKEGASRPNRRVRAADNSREALGKFVAGLLLCALRLIGSTVVAGAVGSSEVLNRREINGDQTSEQEPGYALT